MTPYSLEAKRKPPYRHFKQPGVPNEQIFKGSLAVHHHTQGKQARWETHL
jgi:hypothetical protein